MDATRPKHQKSSDRAAGTLGDVLYADKSKTLVSEKDWAGLVQSVAEGDQHALRELYERTHRIVYTLIVRITDNRASAEELTLDVFLEVWRLAPTYDPADGTVVGWLMNQARWKALDRVRFEQRKKRVAHHTETPPLESVAPDPLQAIDVNQQGHLLRRALTALTRDERQAIETAYFSELTHVQAAARLNEPLGTIKTRIRSGLVKLRHALGETGEAP